MSEEQQQPIASSDKPKKKRAPAKPKDTIAPTLTQDALEDTNVNSEPKKTNDSLFHIPFIVTLIVLGIGATTLLNAGMNSGKTEQELQKLEQKFDGYQSGVKDSRS